MTRHSRISTRLLSIAVLVMSISIFLPDVQADSTGITPGIYTTTIAGSDVPPEFPPDVASILVGQWQIEFTEGGTYIVTKDGDIVVIGRYTSHSSRFVMTDLQGALACTDAPGIATGVYRWSLANNQLELLSVLDRCAGRQLVLTTRPLQKQ